MQPRSSPWCHILQWASEALVKASEALVKRALTSSRVGGPEGPKPIGPEEEQGPR